MLNEITSVDDIQFNVSQKVALRSLEVTLEAFSFKKAIFSMFEVDDRLSHEVFEMFFEPIIPRAGL